MKWKTLEPSQKKITIKYLVLLIIFCVAYIGTTATILYNDKVKEDYYWNEHLQMSSELAKLVDERSETAIPVKTGIYMETIKEVNLSESNFRGIYNIWFSWQGDESLNMAEHFDVYRGTVKSKKLVKDYHNNGENYQLLKVDIQVSKSYWTRRFPLESHQLRMYLESDYDISRVVLVNDEKSGYNENINFASYNVERFATCQFANEYENDRSDPQLNGSPAVTSEIMMQMEINREGFGLYIKCFIALIGTVTWVMISLYICTYHRVNPLGLIPPTIVGAVTNIMVGANLLPEALQTGLLEFGNVWGILVILICAVCIIRINRIRDKYKNREWAEVFGKIMLYTLLFFVILAGILLPAVSYMW